MNIQLLRTLCLFVIGCCCAPAWAAQPNAADRAVAEQESSAETEARKARVAQRRAGVAVICHRGALEFAHENTLEAFRASLQLGADGNEIDIRATRDGVLVCFHDDMLDMILDAYGDVADYSWEQLQRFRFRRPGPFGDHCRIPTLREVLLLHRQHAGLLHLDVKRPGLDGAIAELLTELDMWPHVMAANQNCETITSDARYQPLRYKASLYLDRSEVDQAAINDRLQRPGEAVIVEDPRGVLVALSRPIGRPSSQPVLPREPVAPHVPEEQEFSEQQLLDLLNDDDDWNQVAESDAEQAAAAQRITARARAADELARRGLRSPQVIEALTRRVHNRSLHKNWRYHGLDGAAALRTLFALRDASAVEQARTCLWRVDEGLAAVKNPEYDTPLAWTDFRLKMLVFPELEKIPGEATQQLCRDYLALDEMAARELAPLQYEAAARTLLAIDPSEKMVRMLLAHPRSEVRGRAILFCVAHADLPWVRSVLQDVAPYALAYLLAANTTELPAVVASPPLDFAGGTLVVAGRSAEPRNQWDVLIHFHGAPDTVLKNFEQARLDAALVIVNFRGLSRAYAAPFQSPQRFDELLSRAMSQLREQHVATGDAQWNRICVSSFSAGYGAVREILKSPEDSQRIAGIVAADSIYAGLAAEEPERRVDPQHMRDFARFAQEAAAGRKIFLLTHSYLETPYASTRETADYLLQVLSMEAPAVDAERSPPLLLVRRGSRHGFTVLGYAGSDGEAHLQHLRHIGQWWQHLPLKAMP